MVCNSWSPALKEQGNSLSFLCLCLECSLCSPLTSHRLSSKQTLRQPRAAGEPRRRGGEGRRGEERRGEERGGEGRRGEERGGEEERRGRPCFNGWRGGSGFRPPGWSASILLVSLNRTLDSCKLQWCSSDDL